MPKTTTKPSTKSPHEVEVAALEAALAELRSERDNARAVSMQLVRERNDFEQRIVEILDEVRDVRNNALAADRRGYERAKEEALSGVAGARTLEQAYIAVSRLRWGQRL